MPAPSVNPSSAASETGWPGLAIDVVEHVPPRGLTVIVSVLILGSVLVIVVAIQSGLIASVLG